MLKYTKDGVVMKTDQEISKFKVHLHKSMNSVLHKNLKILSSVLEIRARSLLKFYANDDQKFKVYAERAIAEFLNEYHKKFFGVGRKSQRESSIINPINYEEDSQIHILSSGKVGMSHSAVTKN